MKQVGAVEVPQEAFAVLNLDDTKRRRSELATSTCICRSARIAAVIAIS